MELKELIKSLAGLMSISGYEKYSDAELHGMLDGYFDENFTDPVGNHIFVRKCGRENAPKILVDTHFDEIGMIVTDICDGGFLRVTRIGGLDTRILQGAEVCIYGKEKLFGIVCSTPPHLQVPADAKKLKDINDLIIDTGYPKDKLSELIRIGTPIGFMPRYTDLKNGCIAGKGFDNKACAACAVYALSNIAAEKLAGDVYLLLSAFEETAFIGGAAVGAYGIDPDYAMVIDVNLGAAPDVPKRETVGVYDGVSITLSAVTDRKLTKLLIAEADAEKIKYQMSVSPSDTGTNTPSVNLTRTGIPAVDVGLPLRSMHTYNEVIALEDAQSCSALIAAFVKSKKIAEVFGR